MTPQVTNNCLSCYPVLGQIVTWLIVVAGWAVVWKQIKNREDRREAWELIADLKKLVREIEADAISYWISGPKSPDCKKTAFKIKTKSRGLGVFTSIFKLRGKELKIYNSITLFRVFFGRRL